MPVAARFGIQVASQVMIGEGDLDAVFSAAPDVLPTNYVHGRVVLLTYGQPVVHIDDDLHFLLVLLMQAVPPLVNGEATEIIFSDAPGGFWLKPDRGTVRITGDPVAPKGFSAPADELLTALVECTRRFVAFTRDALGEHSAVQVQSDQLVPWIDEAAQSLRGRTG